MTATMERDLLARLFAPERVKVTRGNVTERVEVPSLWEQLQDAGKMGTGAGLSFGSTVPISTAALDLVNEILAGAREYARTAGRKDLVPVRDHVRAAITAWYVDDRVDRAQADAVLTGWVDRAVLITRQEPEHPKVVRGVRCPECGKSVAYRQEQGETIRTPALAILWRQEDDDYLVRAVQCKACSFSWFRGSALEGLFDQMMEANLTRETLSADLNTEQTTRM